MPIHKHTIAGLCLLLIGLMMPPLQAEERLVGLDEYIERGMQDWGIPGLAVAVVHDDEIIYARGFGELERGRGDPVDADTLFGVASTTKAMTAASLAMLVDEGKLDWDDRVVDHMPEFRLSDPWVTGEVRVHDLLTHRVGVGRMTGNRLRFMPNRSRSEVIHQMRYLDFEQPFRSDYVYSNVMYTVAGELIPAITDQSWDEFLAERLFEPLGMDRSNTSVEQIPEDEDNVVTPHQEIDGEIRSIPLRNFDNVGPSASVNTSVRDMAQWMRLQLGEPGKYEDERLISESQMEVMHQPWMPLARDHVESPISAYGLGWRLGSYRGYQIAQHGGATDGMNTELMLVPEKDLGIIVTTNLFNTFRSALTRNIIDRMGEYRAYDWHNHLLSNHRERYESVMEERREIHQNRQEGTEPSLSREALLGAYEDPLYAEAEVFENEDGGLSLRFWEDDSQVADLEHWHHDTWRAVWRNPGQREKFIRFTRDEDGEVDELHVTWTLRPDLLQVGAYPSGYQRKVRYAPVAED